MLKFVQHRGFPLKQLFGFLEAVSSLIGWGQFFERDKFVKAARIFCQVGSAKSSLSQETLNYVAIAKWLGRSLAQLSSRRQVASRWTRIRVCERDTTTR